MNTGRSRQHHLDDGGQRLTVTAVQLRPGAVLVAVTGDLDLATTATFHRRLSEILDGRRGQLLELDLSALEFCDLSGLRALHALGREGAQGRRPVQITTAGSCLDVLLNLCPNPTVLGYTPPTAPLDAD